MSQPTILKRLTRSVLVLFVLSVLNIGFQAPVHAVMKVQVQQMDMQNMSNCHCPPVICDSIESLNTQSLDGTASVPSLSSPSLALLGLIDQSPGLLNQKQHVEKIFVRISMGKPPALLIKTLLQI